MPEPRHTGPVAPYLRHISAEMGPTSWSRFIRMMFLVTRSWYMGIRSRNRLMNARVPVNEIVVDVVVHPAEAEIAVGEARAGDRFQQIEDMFPVVKGVEQRGESAQIEDKGAEPEEMAGDAVQLGR